MNQSGTEPGNNPPPPHPTPTATPATSLCESLCIGGLGFCLVSTVVFATVAFGERWLYRHLGVALTYALWTLLFIGGGGAVVARLNRGFPSAQRSYAIFALAFFVFAVGWAGAYFATKFAQRELLGVIVGTLLMALVFAGASGAMRNFLRVCIVLILTNTAGYFAGRIIWRTLGGEAGMILWGVLFGLGLGVGLGYTLHFCRASIARAPSTAI